jgi:hypothetical protein
MMSAVYGRGRDSESDPAARFAKPSAQHCRPDILPLARLQSRAKCDLIVAAKPSRK